MTVTLMKDARQGLQSPLGKADDNCLHHPALQLFEYSPAQVQPLNSSTIAHHTVLVFVIAQPTVALFADSVPISSDCHRFIMRAP
jgi:hypothetical protein